MWIAGEGSGYRLDAAAGTIDLVDFRALVEEGRRQLDRGAAAIASTSLHQASALWDGELAQDLIEQFDVFADAAARATDERLQGLELRLAADLQLERAGTVISELQALTTNHPMRERLWLLLMTALYRMGRQADALRTYQTARRMLADEAGLDPGPELRALEAEILGGNLPIVDAVAASQHLVFVDELGVQRRVGVACGATATIGRQASLEVCISWDGRASRRHAELSRTSDGWWLTDLGSTNGTVLNGRQLVADTASRLSVGSTFVVGTTTFTLVGGREAAADVSPSALTDIAESWSWVEPA